MKKLLIFVILFTPVVLSAQNLSKKDWKSFSKVFDQNYEAARTHFKDNIDKENRDEMLGMPTSAIPLPKNSRNYFDAAGYTITYVYNFENFDEASAFFKKVHAQVKSNLPKGTEIFLDGDYINVANKDDEGNHPTVEVSFDDTSVMFMFSPALDISLPMDW